METGQVDTGAKIGGNLETFLVEWKPRRELPHLLGYKALETFLVEWKPNQCSSRNPQCSP